MHPNRFEQEITIIRPRETSLLLRYEGKLKAHEIATGLEIGRWIERVKQQAHHIANVVGRELTIREIQLFDKGDGVPDYDKRKIANGSDVLITADPGDNFLMYLEEEPMSDNPLFVPIIATLRKDLMRLRSEAEYLPGWKTGEVDKYGRDVEEQRFEAIGVRDGGLLRSVLKRALNA